MYSTLNRQKLNWLGIGVGIFAILPFLCLSFYNHPLGVHEWDWISNWQGTKLPMNFWQEQSHWYTTTMGRFFSTAILSMTDWWYHISLFQSLFAVNLLFIIGLSYLLASEFWPFLSRLWQCCIALLIVSLYLYQSSGVYDTFFRYTSVLTYSLGLWLSMLSALLIKKALSPTKNKYMLIGSLFLCAIASIGSNEISLISVNVMAVAILFMRFYRHQPIPLWYGLFLLVIFASDLVALTAPGNFQRMDIYGNQPDLIQTTFFTLATSFWLWLDWLGDGLLLLFILLWLPLGWQCRQQDNSLFTDPFIWLICSILIVPLALFPLLLGTFNTSLPERIVDLLFFTICWTSLGFCQSILNRYGHDQNFVFYNQPTWIIIASFFTFQLFFSGIQINREEKNSPEKWDLISIQSNIGIAYKSLLDDSARKYDQAMRLQYSILTTCPDRICKVNPPLNPPVLLYETLSDRRTQKGDPFMGSYFRKNIQLVIYE